MQNKPITPDSVKKMLLPLEPSIVKLFSTTKKLRAALEDLRECYFDALDCETDARYYKYYFDNAKTREEIADDYARELVTIAKTLDETYYAISNS